LSFSEFQLDAALHRGIQSLGFTEATPIQKEAIPPALEGRDVLACAKTGSGKTAAFALPIIQRLMGKPHGTTRALILTPTRELAAQIQEHFAQLAEHTHVRAAAIFGGVGMQPQEQAFRRGVDVIVATPGRLLDHFRMPYAKLPGIEVLVLDEADRMLDMGFLPDVRRVLKHIPTQRQTMLFSATMPDEIAKLACEMLRDPALIRLAPKAAPTAAVTQKAYPVAADLKSALLAELVKRGEIRSVIAFTRTKHRANRLADYLVKNGVAAERIHGNRSQTQRTDALRKFKNGEFPVLVATDIAARGIDVEALSHVVNFDVPASPEDYVHRVGRTGRADLTGDAYIFVAPDEEGDMQRIERTIGVRIPRITVDGFDYTSRPKEKLEIPLQDRIAAIRAQKAQARANQKRNEERRQQHHQRQSGGRHASSSATSRGSSSGRSTPAPQSWDARAFAGTRSGNNDNRGNQSNQGQVNRNVPRDDDNRGNRANGPDTAQRRSFVDGQRRGGFGGNRARGGQRFGNQGQNGNRGSQGR
jgi:ATP-dependent RNA helicase RhlE